jgi:fatty acid synthase subunit beta
MSPRMTQKRDCDGSRQAPLYFAIVPAWEVLVRPLFADELDVDFLRLLHLSNEFSQRRGPPIQEGDVLTCRSRAIAAVNRENGKMIEVHAQLFREVDGENATVEIRSQILFQGRYHDHGRDFERRVEDPYEVSLRRASDVAILQSKPWFLLDEAEIPLQGEVISVSLQITTRGSQVETTGTMQLKSRSSTGRQSVTQIGRCQWSSAKRVKNRILGYLKRHGRIVGRRHMLAKPVSLLAGEIRAPRDNSEYAKVSGDSVYSFERWTPSLPRWTTMTQKATSVQRLKDESRMSVWHQSRKSCGAARQPHRFVISTFLPLIHVWQRARLPQLSTPPCRR